MKIKKIVVSLLTVLCIICAFAIAACGSSGGSGNNNSQTTTYTVTFHCNMAFEDGDTVEKTVESGKTAASKVPTMVRAGYTFECWCTDEALTQEFDIDNTAITSNISLYARWSKAQDRTWFIGELEHRAAKATADSIARKSVSYKARIGSEAKQDFTSDIVDGYIIVGDYSVCVVITAEWLQNEILNGEGTTITSEVYNPSSIAGAISATIKFTNAENEKHIFSFSVDEYGYFVGGSHRIDNGSGNPTTTLYVISSVTYN